MDDVKEQPPYFVDPEWAPKFTQMEGLETTVLTGLHGEQMMMVLNWVFLIAPTPSAGTGWEQ
jgi:hypothetical protein